MRNIKEVIEAIKIQAEAFFLDAKEFYPFGTCVDKLDHIVPVGAFMGDDHPTSEKVINFLEKKLKQDIENGDYKIAVIVIDITIRKNNDVYDGIELRFFEPLKEVYKKYFSYIIKEHSVDFFEYLE